MGNKSGKSALDQKKIVHPDFNVSNPKASEVAASDTSKSKINPNSSNFSLKSQSEIPSSISDNNNFKQVWSIRHGERMDEADSSEARNWRKTCPNKRKFDPPLTKPGYKQATERGKILLKELSKYKDDKDTYPKCIYVSPCDRTLGTAMSIAIVLKLPMIVIPGLSACAAAVKTGGLIKKNMNENEEKKNNDEDDADWELFLKHYGWVGECDFMTKKEILKKFGKNGVEIRFDYEHVDKFKPCIKRLVESTNTNIVLCVIHREGIRALDHRLLYSRIPYCGTAKYAIVDECDMYPFGFAYFDDTYL